MEVPVRAGKKAGLYVDAGVVYTLSPVHTDDYYARKIREMKALGADAIFLKDPSGLLTPERAETLIPVAKAACGTLPLQLHSHCLTGLAPYVAVRAVELGVDVVHTATSTLANGASHPATETFIDNIHHRNYRTGIDRVLVEQVAERLRYIAARENKPVRHILEHDSFV
jgi:oxaloacetate decarboxylase alpha subunit